MKIGKGSLIEGLGKKQLSEMNNLVSCQVEGRRMQYLQCGNLWRNIGKNRKDCMVFIDLEKAYDRVPRQEVWRCMRAVLARFCLPGRNRAAEIVSARAAEIPFSHSFSPMGRNCLVVHVYRIVLCFSSRWGTFFTLL